MEAFKPSCNLTFDSVEGDIKHFKDFCNKNTQNPIIIDLGEVQQCDSAGLAFLIEAKRSGANKKRAFRIENIPPMTQALITFCDLQSILGVE